ncbi:MAG: hypothetical protein AAF430_13355 [Myxococcota bacterium]
MSPALQFALFCGCGAGLCWLALRALGKLKRGRRPGDAHADLEEIREEARRISRDADDGSGPQ